MAAKKGRGGELVRRVACHERWNACCVWCVCCGCEEEVRVVDAELDEWVVDLLEEDARRPSEGTRRRTRMVDEVSWVVLD